jgi:N6-L-threonylcarbamoyladenine synthase
MLVLGIETSCDETAAAVVGDTAPFIRSNIVFSQLAEHRPYGGIVPEVAARAHLSHLDPVIDRALAEAGIGFDALDAVAATGGPGLIGGVIVGVTEAKAIAFARGLPFVAVNHLEGHALSARLAAAVEFPFLLLLVSGGHCQLLIVEGVGRYRRLGTTIDDAAGEAFDKGARLLGLGYPGGRELDLLARDSDPAAYNFPVARVPGLDFSFSGLKTALLYATRDLPPAELEARRADLAASYQRAIVRALVGRVREAEAELGGPRLAVVGGVAANSELRAALADAAIAPLPLTTDNAAMIASAARFTDPVPYPGYLGLDAYASR